MNKAEPVEKSKGQTVAKRRIRKKALIMTRHTAVETIGAISGLLGDPDKVLKQAGLNLNTAYDEILVDAHLTGCISRRMAAIKGMKWDILREDASARVHKHIKKQFADLDVPKIIEMFMKKNGWGMAPTEVLWKSEGGFWRVKELKDRPARWFKYDTHNVLHFQTMSNMIPGEEIPPYTLIVVRNNPDYDNPYGEKLYSKSYWSITFKRNGLKWWNVFIEKLAIDKIIGKLRPGASQDEYEDMLDYLDNMVADNVMAIPDDASIDILEAKGKAASAQIFKALCDYMDNEVSKVWLGETLTLDVKDKGAYAAFKGAKGVAEEKTAEDQADLEEAFNLLIKWIVELNFGDVPCPKFIMVKPLGVNKELAERDEKLKNIGVKFQKSHFVKKYGLDEEDFEVGEPEPGGGPPFGGFMELTTKDREILDKAFTVFDDKDLQKQAAQILKPVIKLIEQSEDYSEALDKLLGKYKQMDLAEAEKILSRATFVAEAWGRINA